MFLTFLIFLAMVKCATPHCRSGYALTKTEKALLNVRNPVQRTVSVFTFPKDTELRARWVSALRRSDSEWNPDSCGVCEFHFRDKDFHQETWKGTERQRKKLKQDAVPSVFEWNIG